MHQKQDLKKEIAKLKAENEKLSAEVEAIKKQAQIDNTGNQDWINSLCKELCTMEDALGFRQDAYDRKGQWVPTIGPWLERCRSLIYAETVMLEVNKLIQQSLNYPAELLTGGVKALTKPDYHKLNTVDGKNWRMLHALMCCYAKHHLDCDEIGYDWLNDQLHSVLCNEMGDKEFSQWAQAMKGEEDSASNDL